MDEIVKFIYISEDFASIDEKDTGNFAKFIEKFDQGHQSIMILKDGKFKGLVEQNMFREHLLKKNLPIFNDVFLECSDSEYQDKINSINIFNKTMIREIPLLKDEKVVATVVYNGTIGVEHNLNSIEFPPVYWDLISDNLARKLFENKKILISSNCGTLSGFKKRFDIIADIEIYSESNWSKYMNGYYDLFLYGSHCIKFGGGGYKFY